MGVRLISSAAGLQSFLQSSDVYCLGRRDSKTLPGMGPYLVSTVIDHSVPPIHEGL